MATPQVSIGHPLFAAAALHFGRAIGNAQHRGCIGSIDVGIEKTDPQSGLGEGASQIDRDGALADAALAAADGDHLADAWDRLAFRRLTMAGLANAPLAWRLADPSRSARRRCHRAPSERSRASATMRSRWLWAKPGRLRRNTARGGVMRICSIQPRSRAVLPLPASLICWRAVVGLLDRSSVSSRQAGS